MDPRGMKAMAYLLRHLTYDQIIEVQNKLPIRSSLGIKNREKCDIIILFFANGH
jgi:hypothetical protein